MAVSRTVPAPLPQSRRQFTRGRFNEMGMPADAAAEMSRPKPMVAEPAAGRSLTAYPSRRLCSLLRNSTAPAFKASSNTSSTMMPAAAFR